MLIGVALFHADFGYHLRHPVKMRNNILYFITDSKFQCIFEVCPAGKSEKVSINKIIPQPPKLSGNNVALS